MFDYRHPDLAANADKAWLNTLDAQGNSNVAQTFSNHATMVADVMVAARNGEGCVGVAYNASLPTKDILSVNCYRKRNCLHPKKLVCKRKELSKCAKSCLSLMPDLSNCTAYTDTTFFIPRYKEKS